jgi:predicted kinase
MKSVLKPLLVLAGLPGSGKTTYAHGLLKDGLIDGFCDDYQHGLTKNPFRKFYKEDKRLIEGLKRGETWAVADTRYCAKPERQKLILLLRRAVPELEFEFIYFDNNPEQCQRNATTRKGSLPRHEINLIYYYTENYRIPRNAKILDVYVNKTSPII